MKNSVLFKSKKYKFPSLKSKIVKKNQNWKKNFKAENENEINLPALFKQHSNNIEVIFIFLYAILIRVLMWNSSYSGKGDPPMYGDFEAQRHWMEITLNLPYKDWYFNTTENDLQYWGLDYPPLQAYHSKVCGIVANFFFPQFVDLFNSRGIESDLLTSFMRFTVLFSEIITFFVGIYLFVFKRKIYPKMPTNGQFLLIILTYPGLILIDYGHFQYNCVPLGFTIISIYFLIMKDNYLLASFWFVLALNFKQMFLYYSLAYFAFLLGYCFSNCQFKIGKNKLIAISATVLITFLCIWLPFLTSRELLFQVIHRLFPISRGLYEDKVANFWVLFNIFYKVKQIPNELMVKICAVVTFLACLPSCYNIYKNPDKQKFITSLVNCSLAFYLFSFQVHEKSILIVALPVLLNWQNFPFHCFWFSVTSTFSMVPLLIRDDLLIQFIALNISFYACVLFTSGTFSLISLKKEFPPIFQNYLKFVKYLFLLSFTGCLLLTVILISFKPLERYKDLYPLLLSVYCSLHFLYFLIYFNIAQFRQAEFVSKKRK